ncbi:hypothetical protein [Kosmotoga sp. DU53]|uniref:hypothetical protein n=1 Tax=Kosmotoga sp. DU53 TaxID=1310160 RepID=UPI0007C57BB8|nr:hypothetical protein [Kosmotoga sp. DU53]OAA22557.1 hypothetical protein DU53_03995 [Kosmotoga sp. DU53]
MNLTVGKFRGYTRISNEFGQFNMLALDQRNSLQKSIKEIKGDWNSEDLANNQKNDTEDPVFLCIGGFDRWRIRFS